MRCLAIMLIDLYGFVATKNFYIIWLSNLMMMMRVHALKVNIYVFIRNDFIKLYGKRILGYIWIKMTYYAESSTSWYLYNI